MERIMIIGCGGSGKSTLARVLSEKTGLPLVHLDKIYWSPGNWQHLEREEFDRILSEELDNPRWIMDGNFNRTIELRLQRADTVIYLDYHRVVCLLHWIKRVITNWGKVRADMGPGCGEWFDPEFAVWIWNFNRSNRQRYHALLANQEGKAVYIFRSPRQLRKFVKNLPNDSAERL